MLPPLPPDLTPQSYLILGLAHCFWKEEGGLSELQIVEPIPTATLAPLLQGMATSYAVLRATTLGETTQVMAEHFPTAQPGQDFWERAIAAARTYQRDEPAKTHLPLGQERRDFNFNLDRKRILNSRRSVRDSDNVRQHPNTHKRL
ncbi:hypothetical protein GlitD10_0744 [Gloeomargarita lithophora Alchichica-D10]|uniref:Uncharacterized protein n=1 Tax=Gloeomargarita lithophora Alchichica-D10 TaxID=1188229 RepID=A0A1J0AAV3_9CYAN|nr:hypothetical protein [Gloeomargarita lithophora]APB33058.1 hypothetical protein GlitD10_0744 [Gloeomargarita lithophora Alchichica-D10]